MKPSDNKHFIVYVLLLVVIVIWGFNFTLIKLVLSEISPMAFNALRFPIAAVLVFFFLVKREGWSPISAGDVLPVAGLGFCGYALYQILFIQGIDLTTAGNTSIFLSTVPLWTALFALFVKNNRGGKALWVGITFTILGVLGIALGSGNEFSFGTTENLGNLLVLFSAVAWGGYTFYSRRLLEKYSPLCLTAWTMVFGSLGLGLAGLFPVLNQDWSTVGGAEWGIIAYSSLLSIGWGYFVWSFAVKSIGPSQTSIFNNLVPLVTIMAAYFLLGKPFTLFQGLGGVAIVGGVTIIVKGR